MSDNEANPTDAEPLADPVEDAEEAENGGGDGGGDGYNKVDAADDAPGDSAEPAPASTDAGYKAEETEQPKASAPANEYKEDIELQAMPDKTAYDANSGKASNYDSDLQGKYFEFEVGGKIMNLKLKSLGTAPKDTTSADIQSALSGGSGGTGGGEGAVKRKKTAEEIKEEEKVQSIFDLMPDSTNCWLYVDDTHTGDDDDDNGCGDCVKSCSDNAANKFIAIFVIVLQMASYILMTYFLGSKRGKEFAETKDSCYGPNCNNDHKNCLDFSTGGLTSILLIGFLWADVVNVVSIAVRNRSCGWMIASSFVCLELLTAIICGFLVGVFSETDFDAIGGAVGILFVHDLDEKVFASMQVFRGSGYATLKKIIAIALWIILSFSIALGLSCKYEDGALFGTCLDTQFQCQTGGKCIWKGFVCNGVEDCDDESDETDGAGHPVCDYLNGINCPRESCTEGEDYCVQWRGAGKWTKPKAFMCESSGKCIDIKKRCNGVLDCNDGSDENRAQNCSDVISKIKCSATAFNITDRYPALNDTYHKIWRGKFKCNNGQCIDAKYVCDGFKGDCVDGSDEYPDFSKQSEWPFKRRCPYAELIECADDEILCKVEGICIKKTLICDGAKDCSDGADERLCDYDCKSKVKNFVSFQCGGNIAGINKTHIVTFLTTADVAANKTIDDVTYEYNRTGSSKTDLDPFFKVDFPTNGMSASGESVTGECIPVDWRCDGTKDCLEGGSDEELCSIFTCASSEYQCVVSGFCIPTDFLCDGYDDCGNGEDEVTATCLQNGVDPTGGGCAYYKCVYDSFDICVEEYQMCDGYQDCPGGDDEKQTVCDAAASAATSTTSAPGGGGTLTCGRSLSGSAYQNTAVSMSFTMPADKQYVTIQTCDSQHQAPDGQSGYFLMTNDLTNQGPGTEALYGTQDQGCSCSGREMIVGGPTEGMTYIGYYDYYQYAITPGEEFIVNFISYFTGNFKITVKCDTSQITPATSGCVAAYNPYSQYNYEGGYQNTGFYGTGAGCSSHDSCPDELPFCYDGTCSECDECHYCSDGIDGTCGPCDTGTYPLHESGGPGSCGP